MQTKEYPLKMIIKSKTFYELVDNMPRRTDIFV